MTRPAKYEYVMSVIERRIREGDYLLRPIPGERKIAEETGVSYMTARRAITELVSRNVLTRGPNGTLQTHPEFLEDKHATKIVLLYPSFPSPHLAHLRWIVANALEGSNFAFRPVQYVHWNDPVILEALTHSDGAIVVPTADEIPSSILTAISSNKVVVLDGDLSHEGVPSIQLFPDQHLKKVFSHVAKLGHTRVDLLNTQHRNPEIDRRIEYWQDWCKRKKIEGTLWDNPAPSFSDPTPFAYELMSQLIDNEQIDSTAIICTTYPATVGAIRALWERDYEIGVDISICSINLENHARFSCPSITGLDMPDLSALLAKCLKWFSSERKWTGEMRLEPANPIFFQGESCGNASTAIARQR